MTPRMRMTEVLSSTQLTPHMKRIVLTGESLADFPTDKEGAHVKAIFPAPNVNEGSEAKVPKLGKYLGFEKFMRSYTIRTFNQEKRELTIDFAVNDHQGLASDWAQQAQVGDLLGIAGPGDKKHTDNNAKNHLFLGDLTSLAAIAATIERLPKNAEGQACIQVPDEKDIQAVNAPNGVKISWLVNESHNAEVLLNSLTGQTKQLQDTAIFIAAEANVVRQLKLYLQQHCQYNQEKLYASAYWNTKR